MLKFFVSTASELTVVTLSLAVFFGALVSFKKGFALKTLKYFLSAVVIAAFVFAMVKHNTRLINQELVNLGVLSAAVIGGLIFLANLAISARGARDHRDRIFITDDDEKGSALIYAEAAAFAVYAGAVLFLVLPDYFLDPTDFVLSNQSVLSTEFLFVAIGWIAGSILMILLFVAAYHITCRLKRYEILTFGGLVTLVCLIANCSTLLQILLARRIIPFNRTLFGYVKFAINYHDVFAFIALAVMVVPVAILLYRYRTLTGVFANPALKRKALSFVKRGRRLSVFMSVLIVIAVLDLTVVKDYQNRGFTLSPAEEYVLDDTYAHIPLTQVSDKMLHRFHYKTPDGITVRFIIIQKQGSSFGIGFDACEICGATGYYQRGEQVVCMLCDVVMNINTIGYKGGCNPIPLPYTIENGEILIKLTDLEVEKRRFR